MHFFLRSKEGQQLTYNFPPDLVDALGTATQALAFALTDAFPRCAGNCCPSSSIT
jgi:hypothetical protein